MAGTLMRGFALLELLDSEGPMRVSELARRSGNDKATVSRIVTAGEADGWFLRRDGKVALGLRSTLIGHDSSMRDRIRGAEPLVHAIAGVTGVPTMAIGQIGRSAVVYAHAPAGPLELPITVGARLPLWLTAAGRTILSQLDDATIDAAVPADPFPSADQILGQPFALEFQRLHPPTAAVTTRPAPSTRRQLDDRLAGIRVCGWERDDGEINPGTGCMAVAWAQPGLAASLSCVGSQAQIAAQAHVILAALQAATASGATRDDVVAATAAAIGDRPSPGS
ncbi:MAG: helix-turn-helix domain-containing protein [Actinomycetota bacterium]|nr:helix-turn-helix domain-containing protein [Actinomycetota bacterium]